MVVVEVPSEPPADPEDGDPETALAGGDEGTDASLPATGGGIAAAAAGLVAAVLVGAVRRPRAPRAR